jgi:ankyrin repeat protein
MGCGSSNEAVKSPPSEAPKSSSSPSPPPPKSNTNTNNNPPAAAPAKSTPPPPVEESKPVEVTWKQVHSAVRWNKPIDTIRKMLEVDGMVNSHDTGNGNTPLHIAAQNGHLDLVKLLVEKGADVNLTNKKLNTALHMALSYDYIEVSEFLIQSGADQNIVNEVGFPAKKGLEGDKSLPAIYLATASNTRELLHALNLCNQHFDDLDKASFASTGLKTKKSVGDQWTEEVNEKFKEILNKM